MGHDIVSEKAGWSTFGWLLVVFLVATILFALSLRLIIEQLRKLEKLALGLFVAPRKPTAVQAASDGLRDLAHRPLFHHAAQELEEETRDVEGGSSRP